MHPEVTAALKAAILDSLPVLHRLSAQHHESEMVWRRDGSSAWRGEWIERPSLTATFAEGRAAIEKSSANFSEVFRRHHADHTGMVGFANMGLMNLGHDPAYIVSCALGELWQRCGTFECGNAAVDTLVAEFADFVDQPQVLLRFSAQLLNFTSDCERIELPSGITIRKQSEQEVSMLYGGPAWRASIGPRRSFGICEYVIEGEYEEQKSLGTDAGPRESPVRERLDRAIMALRTFKEGAVGYDTVRYQAVRFCPVALGSYSFGELHVPYGSYHIIGDEIKAFCEHAGKVFGQLDPSMEMACSRLADAQTRFRPADRLVDAVIGLEAVLLAAIRGDDRRGELSYRFSLHYSTLFDTPEERHAAYKVAKDLYGLRSMIAHGNPADKDEYRIGTEKLSLRDAALRATEVLRRVVYHFLGVSGSPYKQMSYWERAFFGLPPE